MRRLLTAFVVVAGLMAAPVAEAATRNVNINKDGFAPTSVTITAQDSVSWINRDTVNHQVVSDRGNFVSPILRPGQRYTFQFVDAGTFRYRDALEPAERGTVVVRGLPPAVSFGATVPILVYGDETHLQGVVNSEKAGRVGHDPRAAATDRRRSSRSPCSRRSPAACSTGSTKPNVLTNYQVQFKTARSQPVTVQVQPKLSLMPGRRGWFLARVSAGKLVRRTLDLPAAAELVRPVGERAASSSSAATRGSSSACRRTTGTYRVFMTVNQAGAGYLAGWSGTQRRPPPLERVPWTSSGAKGERICSPFVVPAEEECGGHACVPVRGDRPAGAEARPARARRHLARRRRGALQALRGLRREAERDPGQAGGRRPLRREPGLLGPACAQGRALLRRRRDQEPRDLLRAPRRRRRRPVGADRAT